MRTARVIASIVTVFLTAGASRASGQMAVIANVDTGIENVRLSELRDLFLGRPNRVSAQPVVIFENRDVRERFYEAALSMGVREVKHRWIQVVLAGGRTQAPQEVDADEVVARVAATSGGVGFVDPPPTTDNVRVLRVEGRLPGEPGYPLQ